MLMWFAIKTFVAQIPMRLIVAVVVLVLGLTALWIGYSHYKDLNNQLSVARSELTVARLEVATGKATIDELKRRSDTQAQAFSELERRRMAILDEREGLLSQLDEIQGDCNAAILTPGVLDPDIDALNRINSDANRMLRGE